MTASPNLPRRAAAKPSPCSRPEPLPTNAPLTNRTSIVQMHPLRTFQGIRVFIRSIGLSGQHNATQRLPRLPSGPQTFMLMDMVFALCQQHAVAEVAHHSQSCPQRFWIVVRITNGHLPQGVVLRHREGLIAERKEIRDNQSLLLMPFALMLADLFSDNLIEMTPKRTFQYTDLKSPRALSTPVCHIPRSHRATRDRWIPDPRRWQMKEAHWDQASQCSKQRKRAHF